MAAAHCAHPNGWTSLTPGPPSSCSLLPSFGLHLYASGLVTGSPAPPEPRLLLVTVKSGQQGEATGTSFDEFSSGREQEQFFKDVLVLVSQPPLLPTSLPMWMSLC
ncbi:suppressor of cytokine signaling 5 isoform 2-T14 [Glossophaga mutica]